MEADKKLSQLKGMRLRIYCYLLQQDGVVGVREVQRALSLKSASHAAYHLTKLYQDEILDKTPSNQYQLKDEFKQNSIKINVLSEYYLLIGRFWPRTVFYSSYLVFSLIIGIVLVILGSTIVLSIYLILSLVLSLIISGREIYHQLRALPWENDEN